MPPFDLNEKFDAICQEFFPESQQQYDELEFLDHTQKFKVILNFYSELQTKWLSLKKSLNSI